MKFDINNFPEGVNVNVRYLNAMDWMYGVQIKPTLPLYYLGSSSIICIDFSDFDMSQVTTLIAVDDERRFVWPPEKQNVIIDMPLLTNVSGGRFQFYKAPVDSVLTFNLDNCNYMNYLLYNSEGIKKVIVNSNVKPTYLNYPAGYVFGCKELYLNFDCSSLSTVNIASNRTETVTYFSGFPNLKKSITSKGLEMMPNLTYDSCISVMENLYDFTGNGQTPTSSQGKLKVHANFLTTVGDEISIAINKGWTVTT